MGFAQSMVQVEWAYPNKRQSAYATPNPNGDIDQSHPFEGTDIIDHAPNVSDNSGQFGKGHEFATRQDIMSWNTMMKRTFTASTKVLGHAFAFHCGQDSVTNLGGSPSAYSHAIEYMDPAGSGYYGSGRQQPVFSVVERVTSGYLRQFPSMQVKSVELTGTLEDWLKMTIECHGSGVRTNLTGFTFPDLSVSEGERLRFGSLLFQHGPNGGSQTDISCDIRSFRFRSEYQYWDKDGYCPGSGYLTSGDPSSGQVRNKLEFGRRACLVEWVVRADNTTTLFDRIEAGTLMSATLTLTGATVSGANKHKIVLSIPSLKYKAVPIATDGDLIIYQVQGLIFYDGTALNPFEVTVVNDIPAYLTASS